MTQAGAIKEYVNGRIPVFDRSLKMKKRKLQRENYNMKRYIALLRGINISGKNKISMSELKKGFAEFDFAEVTTHLNSGNVIFSSAVDDIATLTVTIESMIKDRFSLDIPVFVILQEELNELLRNAPEWWGNENKEIYDNMIFLMPPLSYEEFSVKMGAPNEEYEKVHHFNNAVFWSFSRKGYQKTNWWSRTASADISGGITIRTANTVRKIARL